MVAVNDPFMDLDYMQYLLKYDSVHKRFKGTVTTKKAQFFFLPIQNSYLCYLLLNHVCGATPRPVDDFLFQEGTEEYLVVNGMKVRVFHEKDPAQIPWGSVNAMYVCESTGVFCDKDRAVCEKKWCERLVV